MSADDLRAAMARGWPAAAVSQAGGFVIQDGRGGGSRVSAALRQGADYDLDAAEAAMRALGEEALFAVEQGDTQLDADLRDRGYHLEDETVFMVGAVQDIGAEPPKPVSAFTLWPPLSIQRDLWAVGGVGASRLAVMARAEGPKCSLLGRVQDRAAGVGYVAVAGDVGFVHALFILPDFRRLGLAQNMMRAAARWAGDQGATRLALVVRRDNAEAIALYARMGMAEAGGYHYRRAPGA